MGNMKPPPLRHEQVEMCVSIIQAVDRKAKDMEKRWGTGRLQNIVPLALKEKFERQKHKYEAAAFELDEEKCRVHGEAMERAYTALDKAACESGHYPLAPNQWEFTLADGALVVLVRDMAEMGQVDLHGRQAQIWSLDEVANIIRKFPILSAAKDAFPGGVVESIRPSQKIMDKLDDDISGIPFA